jgi:hypothetical protein
LPHSKVDQALQQILQQEDGAPAEQRRQLLDLLRDPEIVTRILQAASTIPEGQALLTPPATELPSPQVESGLDRLISVLVSAPDRLCLRVNQPPPFPPDLVAHITEEQIGNLQKLFAVADGDRYSWWGIVHHQANLLYIENGQTLPEGSERARGIRTAFAESHWPEVFFLLAFSRLLDRWQRRLYTTEERSTGTWAKIRNRAQGNAADLDRILRELINLVSLAGERYQGGLGSPPDAIAGWFADNRFEELLRELLAVVEADRQKAEDDFKGSYALPDRFFPSNNPEDTPASIHRAFDRVAEILKESKGRKKNRPVKEVRSLFRKWGLDIKPVNEGKARQRQTRKTGT